jgi:hypothetical protein
MQQGTPHCGDHLPVVGPSSRVPRPPGRFSWHDFLRARADELPCWLASMVLHLAALVLLSSIAAATVPNAFLSPILLSFTDGTELQGREHAPAALLVQAASEEPPEVAAAPIEPAPPAEAGEAGKASEPPPPVELAGEGRSAGRTDR